MSKKDKSQDGEKKEKKAKKSDEDQAAETV